MGTTLQEQIDWLDEARESAADLGFLGSMLALCSLPRTDQGKRSGFVPTNGPFTLAIIAFGTPMLPYRNLPRLPLAWVCTETVRTGRRDLVLGKNLLDFIGLLGTNNDAGVHRRWLSDQMQRLFSCAISLHYRRADESVRLAGVIADKTVLWWNCDRPDMDSLFSSELHLSHPFLDSIVRQPIPMDLNCMHALRRFNVGLDLYPWLTCRTFSLTQPLALIWEQLYVQHDPFPEMSGDNVSVEAFRKKVPLGTHEDQARLAQPELHHRASEGGSFSTRHRRRSPPVESRTPMPECASNVSTALPRFSPGDCWAASLPNSLPCPIRHSGLWLPPAARLPLDPLGRRKPAARTLTLAQRGVCQHALPMPPWRGPALGSASSSPLLGLAVAASPG